MIKRLLCAFAALALPAGCMMPQQVSGVPEHIRTIGVASSVSPRLILSQHGVFGADEQRIDWDLNSKLVREASALLQDRYKVVPFVINPTDGDKNKPAIERLRSVLAPGSVDVVLLAEPPDYKISQFDATPNHTPADALYVHRNEEDKVTSSTLAYQWTVLDGKTLKQVARSIALTVPEHNSIPAERVSRNLGFIRAESMLDMGWHGERYATCRRRAENL